MRWIREHKLASFLVLVIILSVSFLIYAMATDGAGGAAGGTVTGRITAPFVRIAERISDGMTGIFEYRSLKKENEELKQRLEAAEASAKTTEDLRILNLAEQQHCLAQLMACRQQLGRAQHIPGEHEIPGRGRG